jgi:hypothetical protein
MKKKEKQGEEEKQQQRGEGNIILLTDGCINIERYIYNIGFPALVGVNIAAFVYTSIDNLIIVWCSWLTP